ncbi:MAG: serine kinase [Devosia sp.]|nr:serine kinase [Devosia sp.]
MSAAPIVSEAGEGQRFAASLLAYARTAPAADTASFRLPRLEFTVAADPAYLALCRRALVDAPASPIAARIALAYLDYGSHPDLPPPIWQRPDFILGPAISGLETAGYNGWYDADRCTWQFFDPTTGRGVQAMADPADLPPWEASFPLRIFLHWAYQTIGMRLIHAGTLGHDGDGVLLAGSGGAGKSGTTLSGILHGLASVGDDYVALDPEAMRAYPVLKLVKQDAGGLARLGLDAGRPEFGGTNWQGKHEFDFDALGLGQRAEHLHLKAIILPRLARAARSTISRATAHAAMIALAPSNLQQLPGAWKTGLQTTAALVRRLPAYNLELGTDPAEIAATIGQFLKDKPWQSSPS